MRFLNIIFGVSIVLVIIFIGLEGKEKTFHFKGEVMGTFYQIKYLSETDLNQEMQTSLEKLWAQFDLDLSNWNQKSWINAFNDSPAKVKAEVPSHAMPVLELSLELYRKSDRAFDITISPILEAWGFGAKEKTKVIPSPETIKSLLKQTGSHQLILDSKNKTISKEIAALQINCSALAKGYGVDLAAELLDREFGIKNYMVDIGGEFRVLGHPAGREKWILGIQKPKLKSSAPRVSERIALDQGAFATSGDYQNYFTLNEKLYPHIFDPRSGRPVTHQLCSVSIYAPTCMLADGLATACLVLGLEEGLRLLEKYPDCSGLFIERLAPGQFKKTLTPQFKMITLEP